MNSSKLSLYSYITCILLIAYCTTIFYPKWKNTAGETSFGYDAGNYYWYLPAIFIYKDLKQQKFGDSIIKKYQFQPRFEPIRHENGNVIQTYTVGVAIMELPAFAIAHLLAKPLGYEADGFSLPYQFAVQLWGVLFVCIGLWYFRKLLLYYYDDITTAITLLLLVVGTNYLNYCSIDVTLTHSWLFTLYVLLMLATRKFYLQPSARDSISVGLLTGLIILVRPSDMIVALIPLLWGMEGVGMKAIQARFLFFKEHFKCVALAISCVVVLGMIQVGYWFYITGQPLVYSYNNQGFTWKDPQFFNYALSYRSGWLVYTPLMFFAFVGLLPFLRLGRNKVAVISFFLLNFYIISAWDQWWYSGMGGRAMVQSYSVVFLIIAALVQWLLKTKWIKWPVFTVMIIFGYVNIWLTYNAHAGEGLYDPTSMTKKYYWSVVGRFHVPDHIVRYKDIDELYTGNPKDMQLLYKQDFEQDPTADTINVMSGKRSLYFDITKSYSTFYSFAYTPGRADWLRTSADVKISAREWTTWKMIQISTRFKGKDGLVKIKEIRLNHIIDSAQGWVYFDVKIPEQSFDSVEVLFWNPGSDIPVIIDDLRVWSFKE